MLKAVAEVLVELGLHQPQSHLAYHINITSGESLAVSVFASKQQFFQVKASEFSDLRGQYERYCRASHDFTSFVPRPLGYRARDGWSIMVSEGVQHTPVHAGGSRSGRKIESTLFDPALKFFKVGAQHAAPTASGSHGELFGELARHFHATPFADIAARAIQSARSLGADSWGRLPQHGDFVINNLGHSSRGLVVFDWEDYGQIELPGFDTFTLLLSLLPESANGLRSVMGSSVPDRHLDLFIDRACSLQGIDRSVFGRLIPLYLIVFLYLKRNYGVAIRERIGDLLRQLSTANGLNGAPRARGESEGA